LVTNPKVRRRRRVGFWNCIRLFQATRRGCRDLGERWPAEALLVAVSSAEGSV
jgi:hypothetical protein